MFELYTEHARRAIFFARYEASQLGAPVIDNQHLLLGLLKEGKAFLLQVLPETRLDGLAATIRMSVTGAKIGPSVDLPLSTTAKRVLAFGAEAATELGHQYIGPEHLFLGLLQEPSEARNLLEREGIELAKVKATAATWQPPEETKVKDALGRLSADLQTMAASNQIIADLRSQFEAMMSRMTPELEPAIVYSARSGESK
jgi:ATP-dependent Clp protease ATP-binding subunit ClpC